MIYSKTIPSPLGEITIAGDGERLTGVWLEGQKYFAEGAGQMENRNLPLFEQTERWVNRYFAGQCPDPMELPLAPIGSEFRKSVWNLLLKIPYGQVTIYGEIARALGCKSAQAVGGAVGHNPISIIIPCHRVVGSTGQLTGYAGGLDKKMFLLELENANLSAPYFHL